LRTTHIQQELWTYKKDKAFSLTPTEAINTLYYDDMDILHIDNWRFFTPKKEAEMIHPKDRNNTTHTMPLEILKDGPYRSLNQLDWCPNPVRLLPGAKLSAQTVKLLLPSRT
jgi:hypothetical protein